MPGLDTFGDFFIAAQALSVRGDHNDSDTDGKISSACRSVGMKLFKNSHRVIEPD